MSQKLIFLMLIIKNSSKTESSKKRHIVIESKLLILFRKHQTELFSFSDDFFAGENESFFEKWNLVEICNVIKSLELFFIANKNLEFLMLIENFLNTFTEVIIIFLLFFYIEIKNLFLTLYFAYSTHFSFLCAETWK